MRLEALHRPFWPSAVMRGGQGPSPEHATPGMRPRTRPTCAGRSETPVLLGAPEAPQYSARAGGSSLYADTKSVMNLHSNPANTQHLHTRRSTKHETRNTKHETRNTNTNTNTNTKGIRTQHTCQTIALAGALHATDKCREWGVPVQEDPVIVTLRHGAARAIVRVHQL